MLIRVRRARGPLDVGITLAFWSPDDDLHRPTNSIVKLRVRRAWGLSWAAGPRTDARHPPQSLLEVIVLKRSPRSHFGTRRPTLIGKNSQNCMWPVLGPRPGRDPSKVATVIQFCNIFALLRPSTCLVVKGHDLEPAQSRWLQSQQICSILEQKHNFRGWRLRK